MSFKLETQITISASAHQVWEVLMEFQKYPDWNPFIKQIFGKALVGETLNAEIGDMQFTPEVLEVKVNRKFMWEGKLLLKGIFCGRHEFILEAKDEKTVVFHQNEFFSGFLAPFLKKKLQKDTKTGFEQMNQALKNRCEN